MSDWNILVTDNSRSISSGDVPKFTVRAIKKGEPVVIYGVGDTELQARQDAYQKIEAHEKEKRRD